MLCISFQREGSQHLPCTSSLAGARGFTNFILCHPCMRCGQPQDRVGTGTTPIPKELSMPMRLVHTPWGTDSAIASVTGMVWMWQMFPQRENCFQWEPHRNQLGLEHVGPCIRSWGAEAACGFPVDLYPCAWMLHVPRALWVFWISEFIRPGTFSNQSLVKVVGEVYFCCVKAFCLFIFGCVVSLLLHVDFL